MKMFSWRLQRVLDIRKRQEQKSKSELMDITEKLAGTRGQLLIQKKILENIIKNIAASNPKERLVKQEFFFSNSNASNNKIKILENKIKELELKQKEKIEELLKIRKIKQGMEKLRAEAKEQYIKEQEKIEQKELDENAAILFVRNS